jgi:hypothetical protein
MRKFIAVLTLGALTACGSAPPPLNFPPLDYSYLRPIPLNVASLSVTDNYVPSPDEAALEGKNPAPPGPVLLAMLQHRLQAAGQTGSGVVTIERASITQANGMINGAMTVDINLTSADGRSSGFAEASVSASQSAPDSDNPDDMRAALYQMTKRLMDMMNVQLPYQIMHNIRGWVMTSGTAAATGGSVAAIQATPLSAPEAAGGQSIAAGGRNGGAVPNDLPGAGPAALGAPSQ